MAAIVCSALFSSVPTSPLSNAAGPSATIWLMLVLTVCGSVCSAGGRS
jgi:hypothetical protein